MRCQGAPWPVKTRFLARKQDNTSIQQKNTHMHAYTVCQTFTEWKNVVLDALSSRSSREIKQSRRREVWFAWEQINIKMHFVSQRFTTPIDHAPWFFFFSSRLRVHCSFVHVFCLLFILRARNNKLSYDAHLFSGNSLLLCWFYALVKFLVWLACSKAN